MRKRWGFTRARESWHPRCFLETGPCLRSFRHKPTTSQPAPANTQLKVGVIAVYLCEKTFKTRLVNQSISVQRGDKDWWPQAMLSPCISDTTGHTVLVLFNQTCNNILFDLYFTRKVPLRCKTIFKKIKVKKDKLQANRGDTCVAILQTNRGGKCKDI